MMSFRAQNMNTKLFTIYSRHLIKFPIPFRQISWTPIVALLLNIEIVPDAETWSVLSRHIV